MRLDSLPLREEKTDIAKTGQEFHYALNGPGAATARYVAGGVESEFELTNVCNPLGDMLSALAQLITHPSQLWEGSNTAAFVWYSEQESYNWTLSVDREGHMSVRVTQTNEFFGDDEVELVRHECATTDFLRCVVVELDSFIKELGLLNYHQLWQTAEFPLTYFLILKRYLSDLGFWDEADAGRSLNLATEIGLLLG